MTKQPDVPHAKVQQIADNVHQLMALKIKQQATQAELIRWALHAIDKPRPDYHRGRYDTYGDHREATAKWKKDGVLAREALAWLADKLAGADVPDLVIDQ